MALLIGRKYKANMQVNIQEVINFLTLSIYFIGHKRRCWDLWWTRNTRPSSNAFIYVLLSYGNVKLSRCFYRILNRHYIITSFAISQGPQGLRGYPGMVGRKGETVSHIPPTTAAKMKRLGAWGIEKHTAYKAHCTPYPYRKSTIISSVDVFCLASVTNIKNVCENN